MEDTENYEKLQEDDVEGGESSNLVKKPGKHVEDLKKRVKKQNWAILKSKNSGGLNPAKILSGYQKFKYMIDLQRRKLKIRSREWIYQLTPWSASLKSIEGYFGSGVVCYFRFMRWLLGLNVVIAVMMFFFIIVPQIVADNKEELVLPLNMTTERQNLSDYCESQYVVDEGDGIQLLIDFIDGTGWMEKTLMFYGYYSDLALDMDRIWGEGSWLDYNIPLAYLIITVAYFGVSLLMMCSQTSETLREQLLHGQEWAQAKGFLGIAFSGWDFALFDHEAAIIRNKQLYNEIMYNLEEQRQKLRQKKQTFIEKVHVFFIRVLVWLTVLVILGVAGYLIALATTQSAIHTADSSDEGQLVELFYQYVPSITFTVLNMVIPMLFKLLIKLEDYKPGAKLNITLVRVVFLRLSSLAVLLASLYTQITCREVNECNVGLGGDTECPEIWCWETYIGQNMYRLIFMVAITMFGTVIFVEFPRRLVVQYIKWKPIQMVGFQMFDITKNVLDLVYLQILIWIGAFFAPMIPVMAIFMLFIGFYLKKSSVLYNHIPEERPYTASRSTVFFMIILIIGYLLCCVPVGFCMYMMAPSLACGPFRLYQNPWEAWTRSVSTWPSTIQRLVSFLSSTAFLLPLFVVMALMIYIYRAASSAKGELNEMLQDNLNLSAKDHMYLVNRLTELGDTGGKGLPSDRNTSSNTDPAPANYNTFDS